MDDAAFVLSMGVTGGLIALAAALLVATALGVGLRRRAGRFRPGSAAGLAHSPARPSRAGTAALTEADLGSSLGRQATLVQFSTAFCAPCRPTRQILAQVADTVDGVTHVGSGSTAPLPSWCWTRTARSSGARSACRASPT